MCWIQASPHEQESYTYCNITYHVDSGMAMLFDAQGKQQTTMAAPDRKFKL